MTRTSLLILILVILVVAGITWAFLAVRSEPVQAISDKWSSSGHADRTSRSFVHWDEDEPPVIPENCAKCHSTFGYMDYLGLDGTAARQMDQAANIGTVLYCNVCHNEASPEMTSVVFPSGAEIMDLGAEADCYQCHQGRASTVRVSEAIAGLEDDTVHEDLGFINVHYYIGAATKRGSQVRGAYQYDGRDYVGYYEHVAEYQVCYDCHDPHSLSIDPGKCSPCHVKVSESADIFRIRVDPVDYDGDGNHGEGIAHEILSFQELLYASIREYAAEVIGTPLVYANRFPYFMVDTDGDGEADEEEANFGNRYTQWTPRLVRTAYNYHYASSDPGKHCHNPKYVLQMLYDSIEDLEAWSPADAADIVRPEGP